MQTPPTAASPHRLVALAQAVWKPSEEWTYAMDNIRYFKPLDEPDVPVDRIGSVPVSGLPASWED